MNLVINFIVLTLVGRVQEIFTPLGYLKPVMVAMLVGGLVLLVYFPYDAMGQKIKRPTLFWMLASIGFVLSVPASLYPGKSVEFLLMTYVCTSFLFLLVSQCVRDFRKIEQIALVLMIATLLLGLSILLNPRRLATDTGFRFSVSDAYDANDLALVYAMGIPFVFYWFWRGGFFLKILASVITLLAAYGIHLTGSRGGLLALGVVVIYMVVRIKELGTILRTMLVLGMFLGAAAATQTETFSQLLLAVQGKEYNTTAEDGRLQVWKRGLGYIAQRPLTGVGIVCFEDAEGNLSGRSSATRGIRWTAAHNSYVQVCAENGILTFICWCAMIYYSLVELRKIKRLLAPWSDDAEIHRMILTGGMLQTSLWAYIVGAFFLSLGYLVYLYLLVALTIALSEIAHRLAEDFSDEEDDEEQESEHEEEAEEYALARH